MSAQHSWEGACIFQGAIVLTAQQHHLFSALETGRHVYIHLYLSLPFCWGDIAIIREFRLFALFTVIPFQLFHSTGSFPKCYANPFGGVKTMSCVCHHVLFLVPLAFPETLNKLQD